MSVNWKYKNRTKRTNEQWMHWWRGRCSKSLVRISMPRSMHMKTGNIYRWQQTVLIGLTVFRELPKKICAKTTNHNTRMVVGSCNNKKLIYCIIFFVRTFSLLSFSFVCFCLHFLCFCVLYLVRFKCNAIWCPFMLFFWLLFLCFIVIMIYKLKNWIWTLIHSFTSKAGWKLKSITTGGRHANEWIGRSQWFNCGGTSRLVIFPFASFLCPAVDFLFLVQTILLQFLS